MIHREKIRQEKETEECKGDGKQFAILNILVVTLNNRHTYKQQQKQKDFSCVTDVGPRCCGTLIQDMVQWFNS